MTQLSFSVLGIKTEKNVFNDQEVLAGQGNYCLIL